jgi:23S rRNA (cytosine1962-C5)-methyltransferase
MANNLPRVILQPKRARPFFARHPWVYAGAIAAIEGEPADGDVVELISHGEHFIARGLFNSKSKIRVRLYSWTPELPLDRAFWKRRLETAIHLRRDILKLDGPGQVCRLVFSEADTLSGLTVDRYDQYLVAQFTGLGLAQRRAELADILQELLAPRGIYLRTERGIGQLEGLELQDGVLYGEAPAGPVVIEEGGARFLVQIAEGQKTGFYHDQRDNRRRVADFASGRRVLDGFCYTGGFGIHATRAGASEVHGVDISESALKLARANAELNGVGNISFTCADVFDHLEQLVQQGQRFGLVVLDPPKFARQRHAVEEALRGYRRLQTLSLRLLESDGILVTCCCSGLIDMPMLEDLLGQLAESEKRDIQILEKRGQAADHPVAATCLESNYLKCLICRVI